MSTTDGLDLEGNSSIHNTSAGVSHNDSLIGAGVLALGGTQRYPTHTNQALPRRHSNHIVNSKAYAIDSSIEGGLGMDTDDEVQMTITLANDGGSGGDDRRVSPNSPFAPTVAGGEPIEEECHQLHTQQFYAQPSAPLSIVPASYVPLNMPAGLYPPPPLTNLPTELSDRARLMATITTLSTQCQRLAMQVAAYEQRMPFVPVEVLASFDPIIADSHIAKLNGQLAQLSLLREADKFKLAQLEAAIDATNKSNRLLGDRAMHAERELEAERQSQATTEAIHQQGEHWRAEVVRLREAENALTRENHKLQSTAMAEAVRVIDERPIAVHPPPVLSSSHDTLRIQRVFLEMDEQAARQDMLLTALFDPLAMAMDAGLAWHLAAEKARTSPSIGAEATSSSTATSTDQQNASQQELDTLVAKSDAEAMRHRVLYLEAHVDRLERSLKRERHRTETQAAEHMERLESFATSRAKDRQVMLDTMLPEIEARLRQAYREGLEAGQARARDESKSLAAQAFGSAKRYRKTRGSGTTPRMNKEMSPTTPILTLSSHSHLHAAEVINTTTSTVAAPSPPIRFSTVGESFSIPTPQTTAKPTVASSAVDALGLVDEIGKHSHDTASPAHPLADGLLPKRLEMRH